MVALKVLWTLADLAACLLVGKIARRTGRPVPATLVLFAWSPLLVVETAWSGHLEALGILLLTVLIFLALPTRAVRSAHDPPDAAAGCPGRGGGCSPARPSPSSRPSPLCRRSPADMDSAC